MKIQLNGKEVDISQDSKINDLLHQFNINPDVVVVEKNMEIIDKSKYSLEIVKENDVVEIIRFMGGG